MARPFARFNVVRCYIAPAIGHIRLDKLTPAHVQQMVNTLSDSALAPRTVRYALTVLRIVLGLALKQGYVSRNVAQLVDGPRVPRYEGTALTAGQARGLLATVEGHRVAALYHLALFCGLRRGELLALRWGDIDLGAGTLRVRASKTESGKRTIPLLPHLVSVCGLTGAGCKKSDVSRAWPGKNTGWSSQPGRARR
ncbi:MAG: tyrosine-type recombinase/integrase [Blastochloris sp.]|nr:tyrosine-type recombinase/integrase [Blastochloris sp.]